MTFNPNVPNASQSPGLFPAQNNANYARIKTIISADHVFNDTADTTDGVHNQATLIAKTDHGTLPVGTNGRLYAKLDVDSAAQLWFWNGIADYQITPVFQPEAISIVGSASGVAANGTAIAYADPGFKYGGSGFVIAKPNAVRYGFWDILLYGSKNLDFIRGTSQSSTPTFEFDTMTNNLLVRNNNPLTTSLVWSIIINRLP